MTDEEICRIAFSVWHNYANESHIRFARAVLAANQHAMQCATCKGSGEVKYFAEGGPGGYPETSACPDCSTHSPAVNRAWQRFKEVVNSEPTDGAIVDGDQLRKLIACVPDIGDQNAREYTIASMAVRRASNYLLGWRSAMRSKLLQFTALVEAERRSYDECGQTDRENAVDVLDRLERRMTNESDYDA